jgi:hypothetical protein
MEELIHIDNLCSRCGFFTSDTSVNGGYGCNHKDCDDGEFIYSGDIIDWHKAYRIVAIRLTKRNIKCNRRLAKNFLKKARFILDKHCEAFGIKDIQKEACEACEKNLLKVKQICDWWFESVK